MFNILQIDSASILDIEGGSYNLEAINHNSLNSSGCRRAAVSCDQWLVDLMVQWAR